MTESQKKNWMETGERCYCRNIGPNLLIAVHYSCTRQLFNVYLETIDRQYIVATLFESLQATYEDDDRKVLRAAEKKAKEEIRSWLKQNRSNQ